MSFLCAEEIEQTLSQIAMANLESNMTIDNQFTIKEEEQEQEEKFSISLWLFKKRFLIPCLKELTNDFRLF